jgi:hypothetical protein
LNIFIVLKTAQFKDVQEMDAEEINKFGFNI